MKCFRLLMLVLPLYGLFFAAQNGLCQSRGPALKQVPFSAAIEVAEQACLAVANTGAVPETFQITLAGGEEERLLAAQALGLLAAAAAAVRRNTYSFLTLLPEESGAPVAISGNLAARSTPLLISTPALLAEGQAVLDFTLALGAFPSAVWVSGERLSAAEFLTALATALQFLAGSGRLPDHVRIIPCYAPAAWRPVPGVNKNSAPALPALQTASASPVVSSPTISLFPGEGARLSGEVDFVATLEPVSTEAAVFFLVEGQVRAISNWPPFAFHLDTRGLSPGKHRLSVRAEDSSGNILASQEINITIVTDDKE